MRCKIDSKAIDGLRVISDIPDIPLCMLEGRNGVGKTSAIHLLELISGSIPEDFRLRPALWPSLKQRLRSTSVELSKLKDDRSMHVTFTPELWDDDLPSAVGEWLGRAMIDGHPKTIAECSSLLSVTRIAGNEDLEVTLKKRVATLSNHLRLASDLARERQGEIDHRLESILPDLKRADPAILSSDAALLNTVEQQLREARERSAAADNRLRHLLRALETRRQLDAAGQATETLLARREELVRIVKNLTTDFDEKEAEAEAAGEDFSSEGEAQRKLADAERILRHRRSRLANIQRDAKQTATALSMDHDMSSTAISRAISDGEANLSELQNRLKSLDSTSLVRDLIGGIVVPLRAAQPEAGDRILVRTEEGGLTVSQTLFRA